MRSTERYERRPSPESIPKIGSYTSPVKVEIEEKDDAGEAVAEVRRIFFLTNVFIYFS